MEFDRLGANPGLSRGQLDLGDADQRADMWPVEATHFGVQPARLDEDRQKFLALRRNRGIPHFERDK